MFLCMVENLLEKGGDALRSANNFMSIRVDNSHECITSYLHFGSEMRFERNRWSSWSWRSRHLRTGLRGDEEITPDLCNWCNRRCRVVVTWLMSCLRRLRKGARWRGTSNPREQRNISVWGDRILENKIIDDMRDIPPMNRGRIKRRSNLRSLKTLFNESIGGTAVPVGTFQEICEPKFCVRNVVGIESCP